MGHPATSRRCRVSGPNLVLVLGGLLLLVYSFVLPETENGGIAVASRGVFVMGALLLLRGASEPQPWFIAALAWALSLPIVAANEGIISYEPGPWIYFFLGPLFLMGFLFVAFWDRIIRLRK